MKPSTIKPKTRFVLQVETKTCVYLYEFKLLGHVPNLETYVLDPSVVTKLFNKYFEIHSNTMVIKLFIQAEKIIEVEKLFKMIESKGFKLIKKIEDK